MNKRGIKIQKKVEYKIIACPLCNNKSYKLVYDFKNKKPKFKIVRCNKCSLVYMNPQISEESLGKIYSDKRYYTGGIDYTYGDERKETKTSDILNNAKLVSIERHVKKGKILDIGCGLGGFIKIAKKRGWEAYGLDISKYACDYIRNKLKLECFNNNIEKVNLKKNFFDAITMFESIEHFSDPKNQ